MGLSSGSWDLSRSAPTRRREASHSDPKRSPPVVARAPKEPEAIPRSMHSLSEELERSSLRIASALLRSASRRRW